MSTLTKNFSNKEVYRTKEFSRWAYGNGLLPEEEYLIANYLDRSKSTIEAGTGGGKNFVRNEQVRFYFSFWF